MSTTGYQDRVPRRLERRAGNFVVTWTEFVILPDAPYEVRARRFDSSGAPQGGDIVVNTYTTGTQARFGRGARLGRQLRRRLDSAPDLLTSRPRRTAAASGVFARRFDASGNPLSAEFQVNQYTTGNQYSPRIAMDPAGEFIVVWTSASGRPVGVDHGEPLRQRRAPLGGEFQVNTTEVGCQYQPDVALDPDGKAIVVWTSNDQDGSDMRSLRPASRRRPGASSGRSST